MKMKMKKSLLMMILLALAVGALFLSLSREIGTQPANGHRPVILGFAQLGSESGWRIGNTRSVIQAAEQAGVQLMYKNAEQKQEN